MFLMSPKSFSLAFITVFLFIFEVGSHIAQAGLESHCIAEDGHAFLILHAFPQLVLKSTGVSC